MTSQNQQCSNCYYDLAGLVGITRCPECGRYPYGPQRLTPGVIALRVLWGLVPALQLACLWILSQTSRSVPSLFDILVVLVLTLAIGTIATLPLAWRIARPGRWRWLRTIGIEMVLLLINVELTIAGIFFVSELR